MKVLLTGVGGFIGRHLALALRRRHQLIAPARAQLDLLDDDAVSQLLKREQFDVIVHAATTPAHRNAPQIPDVASKNLRMFLALTRDANLFGRLILIGSGAEYDQERMPPHAREEELGNFIPSDPSALSKLTLSRLCERLPRCTVLRPFGVYGPHEDWEIRFISNALCKALFKKPITLRQDRLFDYVYIDDLVELLCRQVDWEPLQRSYNVTPDAATSLLQIAGYARDAAAQVTGEPVDIRVAQEGLGREYSGDNSRLKQEHPDLPLRSLEEGIGRLCKYYASNKQLIRPELLEMDR